MAGLINNLIYFKPGFGVYQSTVQDYRPIQQGEQNVTKIIGTYPNSLKDWVKTVSIAVDGEKRCYALDNENGFVLNGSLTASNKIEIQFEARSGDQVLQDSRIFILDVKRSIYGSEKIVISQSILNSILEFMNSGSGEMSGLSDELPIMDGIANPGESSFVSRWDHIHPTDTSRASDDSVVHLTGNETISGTKTFINDVIGNSAPLTDKSLTNKKYVDEGFALLKEVFYFDHYPTPEEIAEINDDSIIVVNDDAYSGTKVLDVLVDDKSIVVNGIANINLKDLTDRIDSLNTIVSEQADQIANLQLQVDELQSL